MATNHDINIFLARWAAVEPKRCQHVQGDHWMLWLEAPPADASSEQVYDVITFHGVGRIEDVIQEAVGQRPGWSAVLQFDRKEETFSARVTNGAGHTFDGLTSLNPGVSLLSAYLDALGA